MNTISYQTPQLTIDRLTDDVLNSALEHADVVPREITNDDVRAAIYAMMAHGFVCENDLNIVANAVRKCEDKSDLPDPSNESEMLNYIWLLAKETERELTIRDSYEFAMTIPIKRVDEVMKKCHLNGPPEVVRTVLADIVVGGVDFVEREDSEIIDLINFDVVSIALLVMSFIAD